MKKGRVVVGIGILAVVLLGLKAQSGDWKELQFTPHFAAAANPDTPLPASLSAGPSSQGSSERIGNEMVQFRAAGHVLGFSDEGVFIASGNHALKLEFMEADGVIPVCAAGDDSEKERPSMTNEAPNFSTVVYPELWEGITLKYENDKGGVAKSTYKVSPGAEPKDIKLKSNVPVEIDPNGLLHYRFETGEMIETKPTAWQEINGQKLKVNVDYLKKDKNEFGFRVDAFDRNYPLIIDSVLSWNMFLGGSGLDSGNDIAVDGSGNTYVTGYSNVSWGSPIRPFSGGLDAFVAKLSSSGMLQWNTFLGGSGDDTGYGLGLDGSGNVYVTGYSNSGWASPREPYSAGRDAFAVKLNSSGVLQWNTFLGGSNNSEEGYDIAVDASGNTYVTGYSSETWGSPINPYSVGNDAFAAKLNSNGERQWHTFLGGGGDDFGLGIAVDGLGNAYVSGSSSDTWGSPIEPFDYVCDLYVAKLDSNGVLKWNTFKGAFAWISAEAIAVDGSGNVYLTGFNSHLKAQFDNPTIFVLKYNSNGVFLWSADLGGGGGGDHGEDIAVDASGNAYVTGTSYATWGSPINPYSAGSDAFAAKLNSNGELEWNAFLGGNGNDLGFGIAVDASGNVYIAGKSNETWGNPTVLFGGGEADAFAAKIPADLILVTSPNGGESWEGGSVHNITWTTMGTVANVKIEYSSDGGTNWTTIIASTANVNSYGWTVPDIVSANCLIKVSEASGGTPNDVSNAVFAITDSAKISISGKVYENVQSPVLIEYLSGIEIEFSGGIGTVVTAGDGSFTMDVPTGWSGTATPSDPDDPTATFDPPNRPYTDVQAEQLEQNFVAKYQDVQLKLSKTAITFGVSSSGVKTKAQSILVSNSGGRGSVWFSSSSSVPFPAWITSTPMSGKTDTEVIVDIDPSSLSKGTHQGYVPFIYGNWRFDSGSTSLDITVNVYEKTEIPFGSFDTPRHGSTVRSSVPVTGWALDDIEVSGVKIYREPIANEPTQPNGLVYIGDAMFVEGARPDVAKTHLSHPLNYRGGWGYLMLTNFLPNGGNGTFTLHAIATDKEGNHVDLGKKSITCDNANAVKPFGAIDTPAEGGTASGNRYVNFGWALTPQPNSIPTNGSTIWVYVDGVPVGHPTYNNYRKDIATLFPGYANAGGAVGYYYWDTTKYANGVHTLAWSVSDSGGNTDGSGSRYVMILNASEGTGTSEEKAETDKADSEGKARTRSTAEIAAIPEDGRTPVYVKRGFGDDQSAETVFPETDGSIRITIPEVLRVAVYLNEQDSVERVEGTAERGRRILKKSASPDARYEVYQIVGDESRPLPIGASFDSRDGVFYWQPGPGFLGEYQFIVVDTASLIRKTVKITIVGDRSGDLSPMWRRS